MPKAEIDYSNTIFYKIYCKDTNIKDLYVGLTTNFVQRKHAHKQSCKNEKATNHNCKLYKVIRNAGGWDNWQMEIIAFHNCKDSHEAHKKEQEYFETLGATLNSIEPLPKPKPKEKIIKIVKEKTIMYCEPCNIHFTCRKAQETHNNTNKHHKKVSMNNNIQASVAPQKPAAKYVCNTCVYKCSKYSDYIKHNGTRKHKLATMEILEKPNVAHHICSICDKKFKTYSGLWKHAHKCAQPQIHPTPSTHTSSDDMKMTLILELVKQNQELKHLLIQQSNQMMEQNKTMKEVVVDR
jgi:hypothetical protein